ncbi:MAG: CHASE2 domain-containing protein [Cyclobacteriaceae bacterium]
MLRKIWLDVVLGTLFIFGMMWGFSKMSSLGIFDAFDSVGMALEEMSMTDIVFSQLREDPIADDRIVLVNIGTLSRPEIGMLLDSISQHNPAVIGIDSFFDHYKEDSLGDMMLADAMSRVENLVLVNKFHVNPLTDEVDSLVRSIPLFTQYAEEAPATLETDAEHQDDIKSCRQFWPKMTVNGNREVAFAIKLASYYDSAAAEDFLQRSYETELINFKGNVLDYGATEFGTKFMALDFYDVFEQNYFPEMIEGKVVMFCFLGEYLGDTKSLEDKFVTPLNKRFVGRTLPDMYGGVIHANVVSMVLTGDYINYMSALQGGIIAIILCFLNVWLFTLIYKMIPKWYDGVTKVFQLIELGGMFTLMIFIFHWYNYKLDLTIAMAAIALSGDSLEVYHGVVKNAFTKEGRRSLFKRDKL